MNQSESIRNAKLIHSYPNGQFLQAILSRFIECCLIDSQFVDDFFHFSYSQSATV